MCRIIERCFPTSTALLCGAQHLRIVYPDPVACRYEVLCTSFVVQIQPRKHSWYPKIHRVGHTAPTGNMMSQVPQIIQIIMIMDLAALVRSRS